MRYNLRSTSHRACLIYPPALSQGVTSSSGDSLMGAVRPFLYEAHGAFPKFTCSLKAAGQQNRQRQVTGILDMRDWGGGSPSRALRVKGHLPKYRGLGTAMAEEENLPGIQTARSQAVKQRENSPIVQKAGSSAEAERGFQNLTSAQLPSTTERQVLIPQPKHLTPGVH